MDFMTTKDAVKKWDISERRIRKLLKDGRITGAIKIGNSWSIPANAPKPIDKRIIKIEDKPVEFNLDATRLIEIENIKETALVGSNCQLTINGRQVEQTTQLPL